MYVYWKKDPRLRQVSECSKRKVLILWERYVGVVRGVCAVGMRCEMRKGVVGEICGCSGRGICV